jgi:hypothetical protein
MWIRGHEGSLLNLDHFCKVYIWPSTVAGSLRYEVCAVCPSGVDENFSGTSEILGIYKTRDEAQDLIDAIYERLHEALPQFFARWCRSAWVDLLDDLPDEEAGDEVSELAKEEFRSRVAKAMHTLVTLGHEIKGRGENDVRTEVQRRSLIHWCWLWAKQGQWAAVHNYLLWTRRDADGALQVALRFDLFGQLPGQDWKDIGQRKFGKLCERYGVSIRRPDECRPGGQRAVELHHDFLADLKAGVDGLLGPSDEEA